MNFRYTRALTVEMNIYNGNTNMFSLLSILLEFPSLGNVIIRHEVKTFTLYRYFGTYGPLNLAVEAVFALCVIFLFVRLVVCLVSTKMDHLKSLWSWIEVLKVAFAISAVVVYCKKTSVIMHTIEELKRSKGKFQCRV